MKKNLLILITLISLIFSSCYGAWNLSYYGNDVNNRTLKMLKITDESDDSFKKAGISKLNGKYNVLVISDLHFGSMRDSKKLSDSLFKWLKSVKGTEQAPVFALCLGDVTDIGIKNDYLEYLEFCNKLKNDYGIKIIFNAVGNHDIYQSHWENWSDYCYPHTSFYKFETSKFSWYALDTANGIIGKQQFEILKNEMDCDPRPKIVFSHYPLSVFRPQGGGLNDTAERNLLIDEFVNTDVKAYFAGHNHYSRYTYLGFHDFECPSYRYNGGWIVLAIDEESGSASGKVVGLERD